ncbi:MAG: putative transcriptional regulator [Natronomonas sp.]|jgi:predicted transcriptional regulator|uniref:ArsR/SmtB family transcription factor n=1 Tax=Natronomonas sp. TaxID=2184060 RepID=UPI0039894727
MSDTSSYSKRIVEDESVETVLETLADDECRRILQHLQRTPMSAPELVDHGGIARSTVYRKLNLLEQIGLVSTRIRVNKTGAHTTEYDTPLESVCVEHSADGFELVVQYREEDIQAGDQTVLTRSGPNATDGRTF